MLLVIIGRRKKREIVSVVKKKEEIFRASKKNHATWPFEPQESISSSRVCGFEKKKRMNSKRKSLFRRTRVG